MAEEPREEAWPLPEAGVGDGSQETWTAMVKPARCSGNIGDVSSLGPQDGEEFLTSKKRKDPLAIESS